MPTGICAHRGGIPQQLLPPPPPPKGLGVTGGDIASRQCVLMVPPASALSARNTTQFALLRQPFPPSAGQQGTLCPPGVNGPGRLGRPG